MFRYELNSIFRKHHYIDDNSTDRFGGKYPLSKIGGNQLKDIPIEEKKNYMEMYRPPGLVERVETNLQVKGS